MGTHYHNICFYGEISKMITKDPPYLFYCSLITVNAGKLMGAFLHGVADRNSAVRKAYASALGHLVRVSRIDVLKCGNDRSFLCMIKTHVYNVKLMFSFHLKTKCCFHFQLDNILCSMISDSSEIYIRLQRIMRHNEQALYLILLLFLSDSQGQQCRETDHQNEVMVSRKRR